jgi:hypothetical protein
VRWVLEHPFSDEEPWEHWTIDDEDAPAYDELVFYEHYGAETDALVAAEEIG